MVNIVSHYSSVEIYRRYFMAADALRLLLTEIKPISAGLSSVNFNYVFNYGSSRNLKEIHALIITRGCRKDVLFCRNLVTLYSLSSPAYARKVFDEMRERDVFVWNTLIRGYANLGPCQEAISLYKQMNQVGLVADTHTLNLLIRACRVVSGLCEGKQVHCYLIKCGLDLDISVASSLLTMYSQNCEISNSELVFFGILVQNVVSWTVLIAAYVQNGFCEKGLSALRDMIVSGIKPNAVTLTSILPTCANLEFLDLGKSIHAYAVKIGIESKTSVVNTLMAFYGKCGDIGTARSLFDQIPDRSLVSWNAIIAAYEQNRDGLSVIELFYRMRSEYKEFDYITAVSVISACAGLGALNTGKWVHNLVKNKGLETNVSVTNALIDMYAKCGSIELAHEVFDKLPQKSVVSWTSIISACATHGHGEEALNLFVKMKTEGIKPNSFTFIAILSACRHSGLVEEGEKQFERMKKEHSIVPSLEHCACMVDLFARAGQLVKAYEFIMTMPVEPDLNIWLALLNACRIHENLELAELVFDKLQHVNPETASFYVIMVNIYAEAGRWDDVARLKTYIDENELKRIAGQSSVDVNMFSSCSRSLLT